MASVLLRREDWDADRDIRQVHAQRARHRERVVISKPRRRALGEASPASP